MEGGNRDRRLALHKAAAHGEWSTAKKIFDEEPSAKTAKISRLEETALYVAIITIHGNGKFYFIPGVLSGVCSFEVKKKSLTY